MYSLIVLAGGFSKRLSNVFKPLVRLKNKPLIEILLSNLNELFKEIIIVVKYYEQKKAIEEVLYHKANITYVLDDKLFEDGPLVAMYSGAKKAHHHKLFVTASDYPFLSAYVVKKLLEKLSDYEAVVPIWPNGYIEPLAASYKKMPLIKYSYEALMKGERRVRAPLNYMKTYYVNVYELTSTPEIVFHNINTEKDLMLAEKIIENSSVGSSPNHPS